MLLRRVAPAALALFALSACEPGIGYDASRNQQTNYAVFDPSASQIPQPNDLALTQAGSLGGAQGELLRLFVAAGGFPNDQEVPVTIDFVQVGTQLDGGVLARSMPALDVSSILLCPAANCNLAVMVLAASPSFVTIDQPVAADYVANGDHGTLSLHRALHDIPSGSGGTIKSRVWDAGVHYLAAIRGGPNGVTVNNGQKLLQQPPPRRSARPSDERARAEHSYLRPPRARTRDFRRIQHDRVPHRSHECTGHCRAWPRSRSGIPVYE